MHEDGDIARIKLTTLRQQINVTVLLTGMTSEYSADSARSSCQSNSA